MLLREAHNNTGVTYREFSILCAINSVIGKERFIPKRITEPSIRVRAAGYKSWKVAQCELASDQSGTAALLSPDQVRGTLEKLHERHFFARARVGAKTVKYMLGVSDDQLRAILLQREPYQAQFKAGRTQKDMELVTAIRAAKRRPIDGGKDQNQAVSVPTQSRHRTDMSPNMAPDINICSFNNGSLNSSTENNSRRNKAPLSDEIGVTISLKEKKRRKLNRSEFSPEELRFIDLYHQICLPAGLGFLPVTERSEELDKVLDVFAANFDAEDWTKKFEEAVESRREVFRTNPRKYNTLVQVCWKLTY